MESYPVDIEPAQILRWLLVEEESAPKRFKVMATRTMEIHELPTRKETRLGEEAQSDLSEVVTIATLQVNPGEPALGWRLTITVEDEIGPRLTDEASAVEPEQEIGINEFYDEFIRPGRGAASAVAEAEDAAAEARLARLLQEIETNSHSASHD